MNVLIIWFSCVIALRTLPIKTFNCKPMPVGNNQHILMNILDLLAILKSGKLYDRKAELNFAKRTNEKLIETFV